MRPMIEIHIVETDNGCTVTVVDKSNGNELNNWPCKDIFQAIAYAGKFATQYA